MTIPDLSFDVNLLSSEVSRGTMKTANRVAKSSKSILRYSKLGRTADISVILYADASYGNQGDKIRSTAGRVLVIENKKTGKVIVASWKTKRIGRVCRSVQSAEKRTLEEGLDDGVNIARLIVEVYTGKQNCYELLGEVSWIKYQ